jgi:ABC-2 type transport system ATP-binding protein
MDLAPSISTQTLTRRFGDLVAVDGVNLRVAPGQFFGFLGPNGAGKSTTIKMLTGLLAPSSGRIEILGLDLNTHPAEVKRQIGVVPEGMALFGRLTGAGAAVERSGQLCGKRDFRRLLPLSCLSRREKLRKAVIF